MRAALLEKNQQPLTLVDDVEIEGPGPREVVVKISHCGICHSDLTMVDLPAGGQLPSVLGHEAAGIVEEVGGSVTRLSKGDKVMLTPIPSCGSCYYCVRSEFSLCVDGQDFMTGLRTDGTSPLSRLANASRIIVSDPVPERRDYASNFGATDILDPNQDDVVAQAIELTTGIGVDYAFDGAGSASLISAGLQATRFGGTTVMVGAALDTLELPLPAMFLTQEKKLIGSLLGSCNGHYDVPRFLALWRKGALDLESMISHRRPIADVNLGLDDMRQNRGLRTVLEF